MRVIEEKPYGFEFACEGCGSTLAVEAEDVTVGRFGVYDDFERRYYVTCPICGTRKFLDIDTLPPAVQQLAESKEQR